MKDLTVAIEVPDNAEYLLPTIADVTLDPGALISGFLLFDPSTLIGPLDEYLAIVFD